MRVLSRAHKAECTRIYFASFRNWWPIWRGEIAAIIGDHVSRRSRGCNRVHTIARRDIFRGEESFFWNWHMYMYTYVYMRAWSLHIAICVLAALLFVSALNVAPICFSALFIGHGERIKTYITEYKYKMTTFPRTLIIRVIGSRFRSRFFFLILCNNYTLCFVKKQRIR